MATKLVIDGGWILYQFSYVSGETYVNITRKYLRLMKHFNKDITVVFDGYKPSPKDHDHKRRNKSFSSNIVLNQNTPCTITKARFLANSHNKTQMILLQTTKDVLGRKEVEVLLAEDDADKTNYSLFVSTKSTLRWETLSLFVNTLVP